MKYCLLKVHSPIIILILLYVLLVKLIGILKYMRKKELNPRVDLQTNETNPGNDFKIMQKALLLKRLP